MIMWSIKISPSAPRSEAESEGLIKSLKVTVIDFEGIEAAVCNMGRRASCAGANKSYVRSTVACSIYCWP